MSDNNKKFKEETLEIPVQVREGKDLRRVAGLWRGGTEENPYLSGPVGDNLYMFVFPNPYATEENNQPAFNVEIGPRKSKSK